MPSLRCCSALSIGSRHSKYHWKCADPFPFPLNLNLSSVRLFCATSTSSAQTAIQETASTAAPSPAPTFRCSTAAVTRGGVLHINQKTRNRIPIPPFSPGSGVGGSTRRTHHHYSFQLFQQLLRLRRSCSQPSWGATVIRSPNKSPAFSRSFDTYSTRRSFDDRFARSQHSLQQPHAPPRQHQLATIHTQHSHSSSPTPTSSPPRPNSFFRPRISHLLNRAAAMTTTHSRGHAGHSHGHHHHHDNVYLTSSDKNDAGVRITRIGLYSNLGMAIAKGAGGYAFNSQSMVADAWHSLTDLASDILTLATVSWSLKPPTDKFPMGFGKVESLGSLGVSGMLLFGGIFMCMNSCTSLYAHFFLDPAAAAALLEHGHHHGHSHSHGHGAEGPSLHAAWLAAGTVAIKEWLYHASKFFAPITSTSNKYLTASFSPNSNESSPRAQIIRPGLQRSPPPSRLSHGYRHPLRHPRRQLPLQRGLA